MVAKSGDPLLQPDARQALIERMLPLALVVTPNLPEAESLAGMPVATEAGHGRGGAAHPSRSGRATCWSRAATSRATRPTCSGTGKAFTRVPRAPDRFRQHARHGLHALGRDRRRPRARPALGDAIRDAKAYVTAAIREGFAAGRGVGQLRHFMRGVVDERDRRRQDVVLRAPEASCAPASCWSLIPSAVGLGIALYFTTPIDDWFVQRPITKLDYELVFTAPAEAFWVR